MLKKIAGIVAAALAGIVMLVLAAPQADAIPAFAKKYQTDCSLCHTIVPELNPYGREYFRNGFKQAEAIEQSGQVHEPVEGMYAANFPMVGALVKSYLFNYDMPNDAGKDAEMDISGAGDEFEIFLADRFSPYASAFFEFEGEDGGVGYGGWLALHPFGYKDNIASLKAGFLSPTSQFDGSHHRLTRSKWSAFDTGWPSVTQWGGKLRKSQPGLALFGLPHPKFYYEAGVLSPTSTMDNLDIYLSPAVTGLVPGLEVVGLVYMGKEAILDTLGNATDSATSYSAYGGEVNYKTSNIRAHAGGVMLSDKFFPADTFNSSATIIYTEGAYMAPLANNMVIAPGLRFEMAMLDDTTGGNLNSFWPGAVAQNVIPFIKFMPTSNVTLGMEFVYDMRDSDSTSATYISGTKNRLTVMGLVAF